MNNALAIPIFNEGTNCFMMHGELIGVKNLYRTLKLLRKHIGQSIDRILIISDDGTTDNSLEHARDFIQSSSLSNEQVVLMDSGRHQGKAYPILFALRYCRDQGVDVLGMTDADLITPGKDFRAFRRLLHRDPSYQTSLSSENPMRVSHVIEHTAERGRKLLLDSRRSGIRSLLVQDYFHRLAQKGIDAENPPVRGYGLEEYLTAIYGENGISYVTDPKEQQFLPHTYPACRDPGSIPVQRAEILATRDLMKGHPGMQ